MSQRWLLLSGEISSWINMCCIHKANYILVLTEAFRPDQHWLFLKFFLFVIFCCCCCCCFLFLFLFFLFVCFLCWSTWTKYKYFVVLQNTTFISCWATVFTTTHKWHQPSLSRIFTSVSSLLDFNILSAVQDHLRIIKPCHLRKFKNVSSVNPFSSQIYKSSHARV